MHYCGVIVTAIANVFLPKSRHRRCACVAALLSLAGIGCDRAPTASPPSPAPGAGVRVISGADSSSTPAQAAAIETLLTAKSVDDLRRLLAANNIDVDEKEAGTLRRLGTERGDGEQTLRDFSVFDVKEVTSFGRPFVVVLGTLIPATRTGPPPRWPLSSEIAYVFSPAGRLLHRVGGGTYDQGNGDYMACWTLGTNDVWFVIAMRYVAPAPFTQTTEVYALNEDLSLVLRCYHFLNDMAYTLMPQQAAGIGPRLEFAGKDNILKPGESALGRDGMKHLPSIVWNSTSRAFRGPAELRHNGEPIYKIDFDASQGFHATDASK